MLLAFWFCSYLPISILEQFFAFRYLYFLLTHSFLPCFVTQIIHDSETSDDHLYTHGHKYANLAAI
jgi:hypothetical protein